jgi:hypothetical protein
LVRFNSVERLRLGNRAARCRSPESAVGTLHAPFWVVLSEIRENWEGLKDQTPGERFQWFHRRQSTKGRGVKALYVVVAVVSFAVGVVLAFIPGPAVLFFALSAALVGAQSCSVARLLDRGEVKGRRLWMSLRARWDRRSKRDA